MLFSAKCDIVLSRRIEHEVIVWYKWAPFQWSVDSHSVECLRVVFSVVWTLFLNTTWYRMAMQIGMGFGKFLARVLFQELKL